MATYTVTNNTQSFRDHSLGEFKNLAAFAVIKTDGSVITWGNSSYGGDSSGVAAQLNGTVDVVQIFSTNLAFAALRSDGSVVTWGNVEHGGNSSTVAAQLNGTVDVVQIYSSWFAFAALRSDGSVVTWGHGEYGGDSSAVLAKLNGTVDVVQIFSTTYAFAALRSDGSVVTWGFRSYGGDSSTVAAQLDGTLDVVQVFSTGNAFAALRSDGSVVTWGWGDSYTEAAIIFKLGAQLNGTVDVVQIYSSKSAFAALRSDGSVVTWGYDDSGANSSSVATQLNGTVDVVQIYSTNKAFAALRSDGSVVTWGFSSYGGDSSTVAAKLDGTLDVVQVFSNDYAFAALRSDGSVVTWGDSYNGGNSSTVLAQLDGTLDVVQVFSNDYAFAALRSDGSVVTWGDRRYGGDKGVYDYANLNVKYSVATELDGTVDVVQIFSTQQAFAALRSDGSVITWGLTEDGGDSNAVASQLKSGVVSFANIYTNDVFHADPDQTLVGTSGDDVLTGSGGNDTLDGKLGSDTMSGDLGDDTYFIDNSGDIIIELAGKGIDSVLSSISIAALAANVENLTLTGTGLLDGTGNSLDNILVGNGVVNKLYGLAGNDRLDGGLGADTLVGGAGDDTYLVDNIGDVVTELVGEGNDTVNSAITYVLGNNLENLLLTGTAAINATGNSLANRLTGNSANNKLDGKAGADVMMGGLGNDSYTVDNIGDSVTELASAGTDTVTSSITWTLGLNLENLTLSGTQAIAGNGNALNNTIKGNAAANTLFGDAGTDSLTGGNGMDVLIGGIGKDKLYLAETVAVTDTVKIATGDSKSNGYDVVANFALGNGVTNTTADKLDLVTTTIAANTASVNGVDKGIIKSHSISNGLITFDDVDSFAASLALSASNLTDVFGYLQNNIKSGNTVAFNAVGNTYLFQDGGNIDTVVQLTGVTASNINTTGLVADGVWLV